MDSFYFPLSTLESGVWSRVDCFHEAFVFVGASGRQRYTTVLEGASCENSLQGGGGWWAMAVGLRAMASGHGPWPMAMQFYGMLGHAM